MGAEDKKRLRKQILAVRDAMPQEMYRESCRQILETLLEMQSYRESDTILTYVNYRSEVRTTDLVNRALADGKRVFVPKVSGERMDFYRITGMEALQEGYQGIREPVSGQVFGPETDTGHALMLMPGAVFDESCHRIGYGKGFYDRYLRELSEMGVTVKTLALCFECQVLAAIPWEIHDIRPQMILSETKLRCGKEFT